MTTRDTRDEQLSDEEWERHMRGLLFSTDWKPLAADRRALKDEIGALAAEVESHIALYLEANDAMHRERERAEKAERALAEIAEHPEHRTDADCAEFCQARAREALAHGKEGEDV